MGSLKLGNARVFAQLIFGPHWPMNQLKKNQKHCPTWDFPSDPVIVVFCGLLDAVFVVKEGEGPKHGDREYLFLHDSRVGLDNSRFWNFI